MAWHELRGGWFGGVERAEEWEREIIWLYVSRHWAEWGLTFLPVCRRSAGRLVPGCTRTGYHRKLLGMVDARCLSTRLLQYMRLT